MLTTIFTEECQQLHLYGRRVLGYWGLSYFPSAKVELLKGKKILNASTTNPEEIVKIAREVEEAGGSLTEMSIMIGAEELRERKGQFLLGCRLMKKYSGKKFFLVLVIPHIMLVKWVMLQKLRHHCYYLTCL